MQLPFKTFVLFNVFLSLDILYYVLTTLCNFLCLDESETIFLTEKLTQGLAGRWAHFGLQLGLTHEAIQDVHTSSKSAGTQDKVSRVLDAGVEGRTTSQQPITWRTLAVALDVKSGGNNPLLAKAVADEHRGG